MAFPTLLYIDNGPHQRAGGSYKIIDVNTESEFKEAISNGAATHPDLIGKAPPLANSKAAKNVVDKA